MAMQPSVNMAKITLPTGFEAQQRAAASRRQLAEAMLSQGLAPENNYGSLVQVLGKLAQTWAGRSMQKEADKMDDTVSNNLLEAYSGRRNAFLNDAKTLSQQQLVEKYGQDPLLQNELDPYREVAAADMKRGNELIEFGGKMVRRKDVEGQYANDPNKMVHVGPDGVMQLNPMAINAAGIASGALDPTGYAGVSAAVPGNGKAGLISAMAGGKMLQGASQSKSMPAQDALKVLQSLGPNGQAAFQKWRTEQGIQIHVNSPQEARQLPSGTPIILPDGSQGQVP